MILSLETEWREETREILTLLARWLWMFFKFLLEDVGCFPFKIVEGAVIREIPMKSTAGISA